MRLFTALWPPAAAVAALRADLDAAAGGWPPEGWRAGPPDRWHVTLAFHGEQDDPGVLARSLDAEASRCVAPSLRLAGAGSFPGVAFVAVQVAGPADGTALAKLVAAAGGDPLGYTPHLTIARSRRRARVPAAGSATGSAAGSRAPDIHPVVDQHVGPWWRPAAVLLVRSQVSGGQTRYRVMHRVPLLERPELRDQVPGW